MINRNPGFKAMATSHLDKKILQILRIFTLKRMMELFSTHCLGFCDGITQTPHHLQSNK